MPVETRKQIEIRRREEDILASALKLLSGDSAQSVTMDEIAASVGISKGTLYNHFSSKDDIYGALVIQFSTGILDRLVQLPPTDDTARRVRDILSVFWDSYRENGAYLRIASYCEREGFRGSLSANVRQTLERLDQQVSTLMAGVFAAGIASGQLRRAAVDELILGPHLILIGLARFMRSNATKDAKRDTRFRALVNFVLSGVERAGGQ